MLKIDNQNSFMKNRKGSYLRGPPLSQWSSRSAANLHGLIDEVENATWRNDRSSFATKNWAKLLKNGAQRWICFSKYVIPVYKHKYFIVYWFIVRKHLSPFFVIHFPFLEICISKTCVKQGNFEIQKLGLRDGFGSPNM